MATRIRGSIFVAAFFSFFSLFATDGYCEVTPATATAQKDNTINFDRKLQSGFSVGFGADYTLSINRKRDFQIAPILQFPAPAAVTGENGVLSVMPEPNYPGFDGANLNTKLDEGYGGFINAGYLFESGLEGGLEVRYAKLDQVDKERPENKIHSQLTSAVLNANYYVDLDTFLFPFFGVGAGVTRINADGTIVGNNTDATTVTAGVVDLDNSTAPTAPITLGDTTIKFSDMKKTKFTWQLKAGVAVPVRKDIVFTVAYKYYDVFSLNTNENIQGLNVNASGKYNNQGYTLPLGEPSNVAAGIATPVTGDVPNDVFKWAKLSNKAHSIEVGAKIILAH